MVKFISLANLRRFMSYIDEALILVQNDYRSRIEGSVRFDTPQSLTDAQKAQAKANIGAESGGSGEKIILDKDMTQQQKAYVIRRLNYTESEKTEIYTYDTAGSHTHILPDFVKTVDVFMVNGGNGGTNGSSITKGGKGGLGGYTKTVTIEGATGSLSITVGAGGAANGGKGGTSKVVCNGTTYSCDAQGSNSGTGAGANGTAAPSWAGRSELFGASGGAGRYNSTSAYNGGTTGGGQGGYATSSASSAAVEGSFAGAGGGGGAYYNSSRQGTSGTGYQGIVIVKVTYTERIPVINE